MSLNILIVDDSPIMRRMIKKTLGLSGLNVSGYFEAGNGQEALKLMESHSVDVLLIDVNMPVMDGLEMLERVRHNPESQALPVFIISTESNEKRIEYIKSQNAEFLHKPFTPEDLKKKIVSLLKRA
ncbi:MAG: response regulator [Balneolia bacterium]|nr:response regulator [Balneolia bacterium]